MHLPSSLTFHVHIQLQRNACAFIALPSAMTDSFILRCVESSAPKTVKFRAVDPFTVLMTWDPPAKFCGHIISCIIEWSRNNTWQGSTKAFSSRVHVFTRLEPGGTNSASACTHRWQDVPVTLDHIGDLSNVENSIYTDFKVRLFLPARFIKRSIMIYSSLR